MSASKTIFYTCASCKFYLPQEKTCQIMIPQMQGKINPEDYCSKCAIESFICEKCGRHLPLPLVSVDSDGKAHTYCLPCSWQL